MKADERRAIGFNLREKVRSLFMRHKVKKGRKLGRDRDHRKQLIRNLLTSLIKNQKLETTLAKAKEARREFDVLVNRAKRSETRNNFSLKRKIFSFLTDKGVARRFFDSVLPSLRDRPSGYLTLQRTGRLRSDGAETVALAFVNRIARPALPTEVRGLGKATPQRPKAEAKKIRPSAS